MELLLNVYASQKVPARPRCISPCHTHLQLQKVLHKTACSARGPVATSACYSCIANTLRAALRSRGNAGAGSDRKLHGAH